MSFLSLKQLNMCTKNIVYQCWTLARLAGEKRRGQQSREKNREVIKCRERKKKY